MLTSLLILGRHEISPFTCRDACTGEEMKMNHVYKITAVATGDDRLGLMNGRVSESNVAIFRVLTEDGRLTEAQYPIDGFVFELVPEREHDEGLLLAAVERGWCKPLPFEDIGMNPDDKYFEQLLLALLRRDQSIETLGWELVPQLVDRLTINRLIHLHNRMKQRAESQAATAERKKQALIEQYQAGETPECMGQVRLAHESLQSLVVGQRTRSQHLRVCGVRSGEEITQEAFDQLFPWRHPAIPSTDLGWASPNAEVDMWIGVAKYSTERAMAASDKIIQACEKRMQVAKKLSVIITRYGYGNVVG